MAAPAAPARGNRAADEGPEPPLPAALAGIGLGEAVCSVCTESLAEPVTVGGGHNFCRARPPQRWAGEETRSCPRGGETGQERACRANRHLRRSAQTIGHVGLKAGKRRRAAGTVCAEPGKELARLCEEEAACPGADCSGSPAPRSPAGIPLAEAAPQPQDVKDTLASSEQVRLQESELIAADLKDPYRVPGLMEMLRQFAVDVTLDPDTANPWLVLSEDRKRVRRRDTRQDLPDNPERFDVSPCVLGAEGFLGGRRYWEVEVGKKPEWILGVCRESVSRKGPMRRSPENGYWALGLKDRKYRALTSPTALLPVSVRPSRVGIFLDYEAGEVSFYNVTDRSQLCTVTGTFSGTLYPYFCLSVNTLGKNAASLIICPVPAQPEGISVPDSDTRGRDCPLPALSSPQACCQEKV